MSSFISIVFGIIKKRDLLCGTFQIAVSRMRFNFFFMKAISASAAWSCVKNVFFHFIENTLLEIIVMVSVTGPNVLNKAYTKPRAKKKY